MLESTAPGWTELVNKMQPTHATALAEARAEGRRQGLEEAAKICEEADAFASVEERHHGYTLATSIRSLATNTPETQDEK